MFKCINIATGRVEAVSYCAQAIRAYKRRWGDVRWSRIYSPSGELLRG